MRVFSFAYTKSQKTTYKLGSLTSVGKKQVVKSGGHWTYLSVSWQLYLSIENCTTLEKKLLGFCPLGRLF